MTAKAMVSRRSVLGSLAAASMSGSPGLSAESSSADAHMLCLGREFVAVAAQIDDAINGGSELTDALLERLSRLDAEIVATPATSIDGLRVKARAASWALLGDLDDPSDAT